jgi:SAM-dependent methyltransferase
MSTKHYIPWIGRLYKQQDSARAERDAAIESYRKQLFGKEILVNSLVNAIPAELPFPDWGREIFFKQISNSATILDVGCGNYWPYYTKQYLPDCYYIGIDVAEYNQTKPNLADEYIITKPEEFSSRINEFQGAVDAVISCHNLEHCDDRRGTLRAMTRALRQNGKIYLSFPSSESVRFPKRRGSLNYYDDGTHKGNPPDFAEVVAVLHEDGLRVLYAATQYQPPIGWVVGLINESASATQRETKEGTWWLWGFETVIWAEKR